MKVLTTDPQHAALDEGSTALVTAIFEDKPTPFSNLLEERDADAYLPAEEL